MFTVLWIYPPLINTCLEMVLRYRCRILGLLL